VPCSRGESTIERYMALGPVISACRMYFSGVKKQIQWLSPRVHVYSVQLQKFVIFALNQQEPRAHWLPQFSLSAAEGRLADSSQWRAALAGLERKSQISQSGHCRGYMQTSFKKALCMPCGFDRAQQKIGADTNMHWTFSWS
jgi:hypothetical protein